MICRIVTARLVKCYPDEIPRALPNNIEASHASLSIDHVPPVKREFNREHHSESQLRRQFKYLLRQIWNENS